MVVCLFINHLHVCLDFFPVLLDDESVGKLFVFNSLLLHVLNAVYVLRIIKHFLWHLKWLAHLFEECVRYLNRDICRQVLMTIFIVKELMPDPIWHFVDEIFALIPLVGEYHHTVIVLRSQYPTNALRCLPHRVKRKEILISNVMRFL